MWPDHFWILPSAWNLNIRRKPHHLSNISGQTDVKLEIYVCDFFSNFLYYWIILPKIPFHETTQIDQIKMHFLFLYLLERHKPFFLIQIVQPIIFTDFTCFLRVIQFGISLVRKYQEITQTRSSVFKRKNDLCWISLISFLLEFCKTTRFV